eukprot:9755941-Alexandrium_andersonii.AAC.1
MLLRGHQNKLGGGNWEQRMVLELIDDQARHLGSMLGQKLLSPTTQDLHSTGKDPKVHARIK